MPVSVSMSVSTMSASTGFAGVAPLKRPAGRALGEFLSSCCCWCWCWLEIDDEEVEDKEDAAEPVDDAEDGRLPASCCGCCCCCWLLLAVADCPDSEKDAAVLLPTVPGDTEDGAAIDAVGVAGRGLADVGALRRTAISVATDDFMSLDAATLEISVTAATSVARISRDLGGWIPTICLRTLRQPGRCGSAETAGAVRPVDPGSRSMIAE